jgi:hypothetical protein
MTSLPEFATENSNGTPRLSAIPRNSIVVLYNLLPIVGPLNTEKPEGMHQGLYNFLMLSSNALKLLYPHSGYSDYVHKFLVYTDNNGLQEALQAVP